MSELILVKHPLPDIDPAQPAREWHLSDAGRVRCHALADRLREYPLDRIVTSAEPKAIETGQIVADRFGLTIEMAEGLHEHDRSNVSLLDAAQFEASVAEFFARPHQLVLGRETADEARARFAKAVHRVLTSHPNESLAIVAHGTVITLLVSRAAGIEPFPLWKRLGLPSFIVLAWPSLDVRHIVDHIE